MCCACDMGTRFQVKPNLEFAALIAERQHVYINPKQKHNRYAVINALMDSKAVPF